jgi:hypothetical protein
MTCTSWQFLFVNECNDFVIRCWIDLTRRIAPLQIYLQCTAMTWKIGHTKFLNIKFCMCIANYFYSPITNIELSTDQQNERSQGKISTIEKNPSFIHYKPLRVHLRPKSKEVLLAPRYLPNALPQEDYCDPKRRSIKAKAS